MNRWVNRHCFWCSCNFEGLFCPYFINKKIFKIYIRWYMYYLIQNSKKKKKKKECFLKGRVKQNKHFFPNKEKIIVT